MENDVFIDSKYAELIVEINNLKLKIAEKIAEREMLSYYVIPEIKNSYILKIGVIEAQLFLANLNLEKLNRKIQIYSNILDNNEKIDENYVTEKIEKEFESENKKYILLQNEINNAIEFTKKDKIEVDEFKKINVIFEELIKQLCPEINSKSNDIEQKLYEMVISAYREFEFKKILVIKWFLVQNNFNFRFEIDEYENLEKLKEKYLKILEKEKKNILDIRLSEIYSNKGVVENENLTRRRKDELNKKISEISNKYFDSLKLLEKLRKKL